MGWHEDLSWKSYDSDGNSETSDSDTEKFVYILFDTIDHEVSCVSDSMDKLAKYYFEKIISSSYDLESYISEYELTLPLNYEDKKVIDAFDNDISVSENYELFTSVLVI